jgi:WhiB family redox-sensing transcriptional regulator
VSVMARLPNELVHRPIIGPTEMAWAGAAACRGHGGLYFAPAGERPGARDRRESAAKTICARCPVREPCRDHAHRHRETGIWGGENDEERAGRLPRLTLP